MAFGLGAALLGGGLSLIGSIMGSDDAADAQTAAASEAAALQKYMYDQTRADTAPWMDAGKNALTKLMGGTEYTLSKPERDDYYNTVIGEVPNDRFLKLPQTLDEWEANGSPYGTHQAETKEFDKEAYDKALAEYEASGTEIPGLITEGPGEFKASPGYQFRLKEGEKAINRSAAARGNALSGAALKSSIRYNQDYASNEYDNFLARYYDSLKPFQSMAGVGQTTATNLGSMGQNYANSAGNAIIQGGDAQATGSINTANAITGGLNSGINNYMLWKYMNPSGSNPAPGTYEAPMMDF